MPFHPDLQTVLHQHLRGAAQLLGRAGQQGCFPGVEEAQLAQADDQAIRRLLHHDLFPADCLPEYSFKLAAELARVDPRSRGRTGPQRLR